MPLPFDASTKYLVQDRLADWLALCGRTPVGRAEIIDADLATVTAAADRVVRVHDELPWLFHLELQSSRDPDLVPNIHLYNALLDRRHGLPVYSLVVLLRHSADAPELTGVLERACPGENPYLMFRYQVVRVWEQSAKTFLAGGLGVLPLAPLSAVVEADLPGVIGRMEQRIRQEAAPEEAGILWTAIDVLMGLRFRRDRVAQFLKGIHAMKDSDTYQAIVEEGVIKASQSWLLRLGSRRFGYLIPEIEMAVRSITDPDRLTRMADRLFDAADWKELLATP